MACPQISFTHCADEGTQFNVHLTLAPSRRREVW
jgi:hypothetical protein